MKNPSNVRVCKNKNCQKVLSAGYKHKYCEACRNKQAEAAKNAFKGIAAGVATVGSFALVILTKGKSGSHK